MATERDIVAVGETLDAQTMLMAYRNGIFPWPVEGLEVLPWFCPEERAILNFKKLHVSRRLERIRRTTTLQFTIDAAFDDVVDSCAAVPRPDHGTWITPEMIQVCKELHRMGHAHSAEAWSLAGKRKTLVGGLYVIEVEGFVSGESMFHLIPNASKLAFVHLIEHLKGRGLDWIDIQVMTPHMKALGAELVSRPAFLRKLEKTRSQGLILFPERETS